MRNGWITAFALALAPAWTASVQAAPPTAGTVSIEANAASPELGDSIPAFVNAIGDALNVKGFTVLEEPGHAAFVAELKVSRVEVGTGSARVATSHSEVLPGASAGAGLGIIVPLPTGKSTLVPLQRTQVEIRIRRRGEDSVAWQGTAITIRAAGTSRGQDNKVASDLAQALLANYPAEPEGVIGLP